MNISELSQFNPTPTTFPCDDVDKLFVFEGYPDALSNGFILDLHILPKDRALQKQAALVYPKAHLDGALRDMLEHNTHPLPDSTEVKVVNGQYLLYLINGTVTKETFGIEVRYWNYFRYRYPACVFLQHNANHPNILVTNYGLPVGALNGENREEHMKHLLGEV